MCIRDRNIDSSETKIVTEKRDVTSSNTEVKEETTSTFDPRGSKNIVSRGHINHRIMGDYAIKVDGFMDLQVMGNSFGIMLVKNRSAALTVGVNGVKNGGKFFVFTKGTFDLASGLTTGDLNLTTLGKIQTSSTLETKIEATTDITVEATKGITMEAKTDNITIDAKKDVIIEGAKIYLN